jgi:GNAT superfamily N-acetyltransferase
MAGLFNSQGTRMFNIRLATEEDAKDCIMMGVKFFEASPYHDKIPYKLESITDLFYKLLEEGFILVACNTEDGRCVGMLSVILSPFMINDDVIIASEVTWWVDPEHRHTNLATRLKVQAEEVSKERGATLMSMSVLSNSPPEIAKMYLRDGYEALESSYVKVLEV